MQKVFIDGQAGTTGLEIHRVLGARADIELLKIDDARRKEADARRELLNAADAVVLCLPDEAARESVAMIEDERVKVIDASTAHRVDEEWTYGLPELDSGQRDRIAESHRVTNPGCYATGFVLLMTPLARARLVRRDARITVNAVSGYSGGGRPLIERYEAPSEGPRTAIATRTYGLGMAHKHLPEMHHHAGIAEPPLFVPSVGDFYRGMLVQVPLFRNQLADGMDGAALADYLSDYYAEELCISVYTYNDTSMLVDGYLDPEDTNGSNRADLMVFGHDDRYVLIARLDNLGKGACGAAVQNLNLILGCDEFTGLTL